MTPQILDPFETYRARSEWVDLDNAIGRVSARPVTIYPPGTSQLALGERITRQKILGLKAVMNEGATIEGLNQTTRQVEVVSQSDNVAASCKLEVYKSYEITPEIASEVGDYNAHIWAGSPFDHFAFDPENPKVSTSPYALPSEIALPKKDAYTLDELEGISLDGTGLKRCVERSRSRQVIADRLRDPGYLILLRDRATGVIVGVLHGRAASLERLWLTEEWANPRLYSSLPFREDPDQRRRFYQRMRFHFSLNPRDHVFTISLKYIAPHLRGTDAFHRMHRKIAEIMTPEHALLPLVAEIADSGSGHILSRAITDSYIYELLPNKHGVVYSQKALHCLSYFLLDRSVLQERYRWKARLLNAPYVGRSSDNLKVEVREAADGKGLGVFAMEAIEAGELIAEFEGETYIAESTATSLPKVMVDHAIQINPTHYVHGEGCLAQLINHSCDPNCGIRGLTSVVAAKRIEVGEEVTWSYPCSESSDWILHDCQCGSSNCMGTVRGFADLPLSVQAAYFERNLVSDWIRAAYSEAITSAYSYSHSAATR